MIELRKYNLPDVVDRDVLNSWRGNIPSEKAKNCPKEVEEFIEAIAGKMADFATIRKDTSIITGYELLLSGMKEHNGEPINRTDSYPLTVPFMVAVDHVKWMHRIFKRRGKQGLIDYCKVQVKNTDLERTIAILNVAVFKEERPEFKKVMADIVASKKIDSQIDV